MRWRLLVLGALAILLAVGGVLCGNAAIDLEMRANAVYSDVQNTPPTISQMDEATRLSQESYGLGLLMTPLAAGALMCGVAIVAVLALRWQRREAVRVARPEPTDG